MQGECRGDSEFARVSTDTRQLVPGDLFVALSGPNFDGNRFVPQAAASGACAAVVTDWQASELPQLRVADTQQALGQLGALNRSRFQHPLVAVTGSSGKTSVKEMLAEVLRTRGVVHATRGNLNNHIGVPLTLLELDDAHRYGVIELGASAAGEIAYTVGLTRPQVAILNNAGGAHLEGFGSLEGVVRAKGEIFDGLDSDGVGVVNLDDPHAEVWLEQLRGKRALTFSLKSAAADLFASHLEPGSDGCYRFVLNTHSDQVAVALSVVGRHAVSNGLAAAAAAFALGFTLAEIATGLERFVGVPGRLRVMRGRGGVRLIDDSYNANPESVKAAVRVLADLPGPRVLVLGNMAELGADSEALHADIGRYAAAHGVNQLVAVGRLAANAAHAFGADAPCFDDCAAASAWLQNTISDDSVVLVKGSRSAHMEDVIKALFDEENR
nr:UDP-N-acetylmuramoyl-tripeptide--D-alanyl-D-alanine ligase [Motiliproteus sediminis]